MRTLHGELTPVPSNLLECADHLEIGPGSVWLDVSRISPVQRQLLTHPGIDRAAVGLLPYKNGRGFDAVLLGLKRFEPLPVKQAQHLVLQRMNASRTQKNAPALRLNEDLSTVVQDAADAVRSNQLQWSQAVNQVLQTIAKKRLAQGLFGAGGDTVLDLKVLNFDADNTILSPTMSEVGIGVTSGPVGGAPRFIILYVAAEKTKSSDR